MSFDDKAKDWDKNPNNISRAGIIANEIRGFVKPTTEMTALEFGCGTGLLSKNLRHDFNSIILTDTSAGMLSVLHERINEEHITNFFPYLIDLTKDDFKDGTNKFDVIYTSMTFHHIVESDKMLTKFNTLLKQGGYLCIADLNKEDGKFHQQNEHGFLHHGFEKSELETLMKNNGFNPVFYKIILEIEKTFENGEVKKYPVFLIIAKNVNPKI